MIIIYDYYYYYLYGTEIDMGEYRSKIIFLEMSQNRYERSSLFSQNKYEWFF